MRIRHTAIVVQDMAKMIEHYRKLGLYVSSDTTEQVRIVKMSDGQTQLELLQYESQSENNLRKLGLSHIAFIVDPEGNCNELVVKGA